MPKAFLGLLAAVLATVLAAKLTYEAAAGVGGDGPVNEPWAQNKMQFVAWNNERWTAWIVRDEFGQIPENTAAWNRHANITVAFVGWEGEPFQAKIDGASFMLAHRGDWNGTIEVLSAIRYRDWEGRPQLRTVAQLSR
jgi:hypothetical protein